MTSSGSTSPPRHTQLNRDVYPASPGHDMTCGNPQGARDAPGRSGQGADNFPPGGGENRRSAQQLENVHPHRIRSCGRRRIDIQVHKDDTHSCGPANDPKRARSGVKTREPESKTAGFPDENSQTHELATAPVSSAPPSCSTSGATTTGTPRS